MARTGTTQPKGRTSGFTLKKEQKALTKQIKKKEKKEKNVSKIPFKPKQEREDVAKAQPKGPRYTFALKNLQNWVKNHTDATAEEKQTILSQILSDEFPEFSFVGFYDAKEGDSKKIYIGEYVSNGDIFPCGEIEYGKGQCGLCASTKKVLIAHDTKLLENYISCDQFTRSEIVLPVLNADGSFKTQLDIDSPNVGTFDAEDQKWLEELLRVIY